MENKWISYKDYIERNEIIYITITKVDGTIERGIHVSPKDIDDLLDDFVVGEKMDGHGIITYNW